jgi:hypothetical protein
MPDNIDEISDGLAVAKSWVRLVVHVAFKAAKH